VNAFHIMGAILAVWAVAVSVIGMRSSSFPGSARVERLLMGVSALLVVLAVAAAIYTGLEEESEPKSASVAPLMLVRG
jgi:hypothetical protein